MSLSVSEIQKLSMFRGIRPEDLPVMLECLKGYEKTFRKNENISIEQENIRNVGVIISGTVDMIKEDIKTIKASRQADFENLAIGN